MFLNIFDSIRNFFKNMIENISFSSIVSLLFGVVLGILICFVVFLVLYSSSINKNDKRKIKNIEVDDEKKALANAYIQACKDEFSEESKDISLGSKLRIAKELAIELATNIALIFYPKSKHPLAELSAEELIKLDYYIMERIEKELDKPILRKLKRIRVSAFLNYSDAIKEVSDNKIVKQAKKMKIGGIGAIISNALHIFDVGYFVRKTGISIALKGLNAFLNNFVTIVGEEVFKIYSKNIFVSDEDIEKELENIEEEKG